MDRFVSKADASLEKEAQQPEAAIPVHITELLKAWQAGDGAALGSVIEEIYPEMKRMAAFYLSKESHQHTLQPTSLVHELYPRILAVQGKDFPNRGRFFHFLGKLMRHLLIDHAREKHAKKRGGKRQPESLDDEAAKGSRAPGHPDTYLMLDQMLENLKRVDSQKHDIFEMWFFAGLDPKEIATYLGKSAITVRQHLRSAKSWLAQKLIGSGSESLFS